MIFLVFLFSMTFIVFFNVNAISADQSIIYVNSSHGNDNWDGNSWATAKLSIKNAVGTVTNGGTVNIANGLYQGENNTNIAINKNITIKGQNQASTIINGTNSARVFQIQSGVNVTIYNLTVVNGYSSGSGGAIYTIGNLSVENCTFNDNIASINGGAIYSYYGTLNVKNCNFTYDRSGYNSGGAIYKEFDNLTIENCNFLNNTAVDCGAVCSRDALNITRSNFIGNIAQNEAGSIGIFGSSTSVTYITYCTFSNNTAYYSYDSYTVRGEGGAIYCGRNLIMEHNIFTNNTALQGGAIYGSSLDVINCIFNGNTAYQQGGAICGGTFSVNGSTLTNNTAGYGGAVCGGAFSISGSTLTNNIASYGGAIESIGGNSEVHFNRIVGNTAPTGGDLYCTGGTLDATSNWWGSNNPDGSRFSNGGDSSGVGTINYNPWIILKINGTPLLLSKNGISIILTDLTWDVNNLYPVGGHIPDGIPINFNTSLGTILNSSLINGIAQSTLNAGIVSGIADVSVALDNEIVHTSVTIDATAPVVTADSSGKFVSTDLITVILSSEIDATIYYKLNNGTWYPFKGSGTVLISNLGTNSLEFYAVDTAGNPSDHIIYNYTIDKTAPTSWTNYKTGSYNTNKAITLSMSESGTIYYTKNGTSPTTASTKYTGPITITSTTTLKFIAVDKAGNKSPIYTQKYIIDKTAPKLTLTSPKNGATGVSRTKSIAIKFSENIKASNYWSKIVVKDKYGHTVKISKSISGNILYIKTGKRISNSYYTVSVPKAAIKDNAGNNFTKLYTFKFKTGKY